MFKPDANKDPRVIGISIGTKKFQVRIVPGQIDEANLQVTYKFELYELPHSNDKKLVAGNQVTKQVIEEYIQDVLDTELSLFITKELQDRNYYAKEENNEAYGGVYTPHPRTLDWRGRE